MKTRGRAQSRNIEDKRAYFGTQSVSKMPQSGRVNMFVLESHKAGRDYSGPQSYNKFQKPVRGGTKKRTK